MAIAVTPRSVGLMLAATLAAGWYRTTTTPNTTPGVQVLQQSRTSGARHQELRSADTTIPNTARLRDRMPQSPAPRRGRNPFVYGSRHSRSGEVSERQDEAKPLAAEPAAPALPMFRLSGIAANVENGSPVLTAIVIDNGTMVLVKAGDKLSNGYSVVRVDEGSVTLVDAQGVTQTIRLP